MDDALRAKINEGLPVKVEPLAKLAGIARNTLYLAIRDGSVRAIRIGTALRIPAHEARRLLGWDADKPAKAVAQPPIVKRGRGRPRKHPLPTAPPPDLPYWM